MRISYWSSDGCSSVLVHRDARRCRRPPLRGSGSQPLARLLGDDELLLTEVKVFRRVPSPFPTSPAACDGGLDTAWRRRHDLFERNRSGDGEMPASGAIPQIGIDAKMARPGPARRARVGGENTRGWHSRGVATDTGMDTGT